MDVNKILKADILDIIFEGRNKDYGAYDLRKTYRKRMIMSVIGMMSLMLVTGVSYVIANNAGDKDKAAAFVDDVTLKELPPPEEKKPELPPPPPPKVEPPKVEITKFTPPKIVKDDDLKEEDKPPVQEDLTNTKIGTINQDGPKDEGITAPPVADAGKGVYEAPKKVEEDEAPFTKVEIESAYPGGLSAWTRYLTKTFHYPEQAVDNGIQGTVVVQFIVDREGNVSDAEAVSGPTYGGLREEAIRVIKKSGKWEPAVQNGRKVKSYKKQPITFRLDSE